MPHCVDFWKRWEKERNFCGLSVQHASKLDRHYNFVKTLSQEYCIELEVILKLFSSAASSNSAFIGLKPDSKIREATIKKIIECLREGKQIRQIDMIEWTGVRTWSDEVAKENLHPLAYNSFRAGQQRKQASIERAKTSGTDNMPCAGGQSAGDAHDFSLESRIGYINRITSVGQKNIISLLISEGHAKDEYDAFSKALGWAVDRIKKPPVKTENIKSIAYSCDEKNEESWPQIGEAVIVVSGTNKGQTGEIIHFTENVEPAAIKTTNDSILFENFKDIEKIIEESQESKKPSANTEEKSKILDAKGQPIFVGAKVRQVFGKTRANGTGDVRAISEEGQVNVKFAFSQKVLPASHFEMVKIEERK